MKKYQKRVFEEQRDVEEKKEKLRKWLEVETNEFQVSEEMFSLMKRQLLVMAEYSTILFQRIMLFKEGR